MYIADYGNNKIRVVNKSGYVSTFAGNSRRGLARGKDGKDSNATFSNPYNIVIDQSDFLYVSDQFNHKIRKITPDGVVSSLLYSGDKLDIMYPQGLALNSTGDIFLSSNFKIVKITPALKFSVVAGSDVYGFKNGVGEKAVFAKIGGLVNDNEGNIYVADSENHVIRKVTSAGVVTTFAGTGKAGDINGKKESASFNNPVALAIDKNGDIYVADNHNFKIRKITSDGIVSTFAGNGVEGNTYTTRLSASFDNIYGMAFDKDGNLYVADAGCHSIKIITKSGIVNRYIGIDGKGDNDGFINRF
jgi:sugar lactone lactonase YvrE